jgi:4-carboxymuconolactone decarboxylase
MKSVLATVATLFLCPFAVAAERFPLLSPDKLTLEQQKYVQALIDSPRAGGTAATPEAVAAMLRRDPFNVWMRSPELGQRAQAGGEHIRYKTSIPFRLNEFAILITARHWTSQYEWYAHYPLAIKAGLDPKVAAQLAENKRPDGMQDDEAAVYDFCIELHCDKKVSDATYQRAVALFKEQGVVDLIGVSGYYTLVAMTLNVAEVQVPTGQKEPLTK